MLGEGFLRDVLGVSAEALADPAFDTLAFAGFTADEIAAAEAYAPGAGDARLRRPAQALRDVLAAPAEHRRCRRAWP